MVGGFGDARVKGLVPVFYIVEAVAKGLGNADAVNTKRRLVWSFASESVAGRCIDRMFHFGFMSVSG